MVAEPQEGPGEAGNWEFMVAVFIVGLGFVCSNRDKCQDYGHWEGSRAGWQDRPVQPGS